MTQKDEWNHTVHNTFDTILKDDKSVTNSKKDWVNHPAHYNGHTIKTSKGKFEYETIDLITSEVARLTKNGMSPEAAYCIGNAIKYINRAGEKAGDYGKDDKAKMKEDLAKSVWYIQKAVDLVE